LRGRQFLETVDPFPNGRFETCVILAVESIERESGSEREEVRMIVGFSDDVPRRTLRVNSESSSPPLRPRRKIEAFSI